MNKKLLTLAVAAAMAVPAIASAEAILYGKVNVSLDYIDVEQNATFFRPGGMSHAPSFNLATFNGGTYPGGGYGADTAQALGNFAGGTNFLLASPGWLVQENLSKAQQAKYNQVATDTYNATMATGKYTQAVAQNYAQQMALAAAAAFSDPGLPPTDAKQKAYLANLATAQNSAFATEGPVAGAAAINKYVADQKAQINTNVTLGAITKDAGNAAIARLNFLQNQALGSAALGRAFTRGTEFKGWGMDTSWQGPSDRIGVKGSEDLGNGLKAVYQVEIGVDITNAWRDNNIANGNRADGFAMRNSFVGLAGDWGTFLLGRHDTPLKLSTAKLDLFADTLADMNNTIGFQDLRVDNAVAYISPSWSGFQLMAAMVPQGGATALGVYNVNEDSVAGAYSLAAIYKNGPFYGSVAYESLEAENFAADNTNYELLYGVGNTAESDNKVRVGLGLLDWNGFSLTAMYEDRTHILGAPTDSDGNFFQVQAGYAFGSNMVKAMWGRADLNRCADPNGVGFRYTCPSSTLGTYFAGDVLVQNNEKNSWAIGYDYNFSKRTTAFALYTDVQDKNADANWSGFSIGMMHSF